MKICTKCGTQCPDHTNFCKTCGAPLPATGSGYEGQQVTPNESRSTGSVLGIQSRSIPLCIIFSIITCGIYTMYWIYKLNNETNQLTGKTGRTSGGMVLLFWIITCGIYGIYWCYKMGENVEEMRGLPKGNTGILYLVLALIGFSIIPLCLIQDAINDTIAA